MAGLKAAPREWAVGSEERSAGGEVVLPHLSPVPYSVPPPVVTVRLGLSVVPRQESPAIPPEPNRRRMTLGSSRRRYQPASSIGAWPPAGGRPAGPGERRQFRRRLI